MDDIKYKARVLTGVANLFGLLALCLIAVTALSYFGKISGHTLRYGIACVVSFIIHFGFASWGGWLKHVVQQQDKSLYDCVVENFEKRTGKRQ